MEQNPKNPETSLVTMIVDEDIVGLTIWRLLEGGSAIGRFFSSRRGSGSGEREIRIVYTEMDSGVHSGGAPRRISWGDVIVDEGVNYVFTERSTPRNLNCIKTPYQI